MNYTIYLCAIKATTQRLKLKHMTQTTLCYGNSFIATEVSFANETEVKKYMAATYNVDIVPIKQCQTTMSKAKNILTYNNGIETNYYRCDSKSGY